MKAAMLDSRKQIEKEADEHISLGMLLRIRRLPAKAAAVRRIMAEPLSVAQKIERIRLLDAEAGAEQPERPAPEAAGTEERGEHRELARTLQAVKVQPAAVSYWRYLLRERSKIRAFGRRTHTLLASWLPPGVRADPRLLGFFEQYLQPWAAELARRIEPVLDLGWLHLTKRQYNWVVVLRQLCERLLATPFARFNIRDPNLIDGLRRLESLFLLLHYDENATQRLLSSLRTVFEKKSRLESEYGPVAELVNRLLSEELTLPSLWNCLLALNMVKTRRFLRLSDLIRPGLGDAVSSKEYDCSPQARRKIEEFVESSLEMLQALHEQLVEVRRINGYLANDESGNLDTRLLAAFYETEAKGEGVLLEKDLENVMVLAPRFFTAFDRAFQALLNGTVAFAGGGKGAVFSPDCFQTELTRLRNAIEKLERVAFTYANFPYKRYLQIRSSTVGAIPKEVEVLQLFDEGLSVIFGLGQSLARLLAMDGVGAPEGGGEHPVEASALQGKPFRLPFAGRKLQAKGFLQGKSVAELLGQVAGICLTADVLFQDPAIFMLLGKERKISSQLQLKLAQLEHLVDEKTFTELRPRYA
jgi:hypothetical protein